MNQLISYNFSTVENPLSDGGKFTALNDGNFVGNLQVIAGNLCEPANTGPIDSPGVFYNGITWPNDQYSEMTLTTFGAADASPQLILRQGTATSGNQYWINIIPGDYVSLNAGSIVTLVTWEQDFSQGDIARAAVQGNVITLYRNGILVQSYTDTNNYYTSGSAGFGLFALNNINQSQTSLWAGGGNVTVPQMYDYQWV